MNKKLEDFVQEWLEEERQRGIKADKQATDIKRQIDRYLDARIEQAKASVIYDTLLIMQTAIMQVEAKGDLESIIIYKEEKLPKNKTIIQIEGEKEEKAE